MRLNEIMQRTKPIHPIVAGIVLLVSVLGCTLFSPRDLQPFPAGYIDSPYVTPNETAIYFLHSAAAILDIMQSNQWAQPVTPHLPGHQASEGEFWWNTDIYVSFRNADGSWRQPQNLGTPINSEHMECCPWVNDEQTMLIFTRESVTEPSLSGTFLSQKPSSSESWGTPERLPGELGLYGSKGYIDFHLLPSGNLYFWSELEEGNGTLYWAKNIGPNKWAPAEKLPSHLQTELDETQPWVNDAETTLCFNRRGEDGNTQLLCTTRADPLAEWGVPVVVQLTNFADANGASVWGEPSFTRDNKMCFVRFNTSFEKWKGEILVAEWQGEGSYGVPQKLVFK